MKPAPLEKYLAAMSRLLVAVSKLESARLQHQAKVISLRAEQLRREAP